MSQTSSTKNNAVSARQIAFFAAFILPVYKLVEAPSLLAAHAKGDLLLPALIHFFSQLGVIIALLIAASKSRRPLMERLQEKLGKKLLIFYGFYAVYYLFAAVLPLLDLEKLVYAAFYDTAPTLFSFGAFFLLVAFVCTKHLRSVGRFADLSVFLFVLPFLALIIMALVEADFSSLLPFFERDLTDSLTAVSKTTAHFSDAALLFPLLLHTQYEKGDSKKILGGYGVGAALTLVFLAVFYGVFTTVAPREHYAFLKIAQYFPALSVIGRIDLLFSYCICAVLFFCTCLPLQYATGCLSTLIGEDKRPWIAAAIAFVSFLFTLFCNRFYDSIYGLFGGVFLPVFIIGCNTLPSLPSLLFLKKKSKKEKT